MVIAMVLLGFNDLFFPEKDFMYSYFQIVQKWTNDQYGKLKKN